MLHFTRRNASGFTLTEMAIVLAVVGVLAAGLWNLLSGANTQMRDESAASQQEELMTAVKTFLASSDGQNYMANNKACGSLGTCAPLANFPLPLPSTAHPAGSATCNTDGNLTAVFNSTGPSPSQAATWCSDLPVGFSAGATGTTNAYGQNYLIQVLRDSTPNTGATPPNTYSFMIMTTGGDTISDTSGARISSLIGGDGGFIYSAIGGVCGSVPTVASWACGSYGGWATTPNATYGFATASASGTIASRTYASPQQGLFFDWLARIQLPGDTTYTYNTMKVPEYLGGQALVMGPYNPGILPPPALGAPGATGADLYMGTYGPTVTTGGGNIDMQSGSVYFNNDNALGAVPPALPSTGAINMQGGTVNMNAPGATANGGVINAQGGTINMNTTGATTLGGTINLQDGALLGTDVSGNHDILINGSTANIASGNSPVDVTMPCTIASYNAGTSTWVDSGGNPCGFAIQTTSLESPGLISAFGFYAGTFVYSTSDIRLKTNIHPLADPLTDIMRLNPVSFTYKSDGKDSMGFIAQDLEKIYPQLVAAGNKGMKSIGYDGLIAPLVGAIQELKKDNDDLRQELKADEKRQRELEKELGKSSRN